MKMDFLFFLNSILLGIGLAMDAFSVSLANGLNEPAMKFPRMSFIAGCYGFFQFFMPLTGWFCVHFAVEKFSVFEKFIPFIALFLLLFIGGKMLLEGIKNNETEEGSNSDLSFSALIIQGIATSIDALSVGFTISNHTVFMAIVSSLIIAAVTYLICIVGLILGKKAGTVFSSKASILGGTVLILIGIEIFVKGVFYAT